MDNIKPPQFISLVFGYYPNVDRESLIAYDLSLHNRFSIAMAPYIDWGYAHTQDEERQFDTEMFLALLQSVMSQLPPYDSISIQFEKGDEQSFLSIADAIPAINENVVLDNFPPLSIQLQSGAERICHIEYEPYDAIGGPEAYHDCCVFAFYTKPYTREALIDSILSICNEHDYQIKHLLKGRAIPNVSYPLKVRLKRFLLGKHSP